LQVIASKAKDGMKRFSKGVGFGLVLG